MADRVAVISIIVENPDSVEPLNALLHEYGSYIIGRMGAALSQARHKHNSHCGGRSGGRNQRSVRQGRTIERSKRQDGVFRSLRWTRLKSF